MEATKIKPLANSNAIYLSDENSDFTQNKTKLIEIYISFDD